MRRGLLLSGVVAALVGLGAMPSGASAKKLAWQFTTTGLISINHTDKGEKGEGSDCSNLGHKRLAPFDDHYKLTLSWDTVYRVTFNSDGTSDAEVESRHVSVHGTHFSYGGFFYDGCRKVSYGPGGKPCTGTVSNNGPAALLGKFVDDNGTEKIRIDLEPFGPLVASPASCQDDDDPPATYDASDEMNLSGVSQKFTGHLLSTRESLSDPHSKTIHDPVDWHKDCSHPGNEKGETDACQTTWTGDVYLAVRPQGHS